MSQLTVEVEENQELLAFDWDGPVLKSDHGFPMEQPPRANGDWTTPVNFADGRLKIWVVIGSQPVPQSMRLQFCFWQLEDFSVENCTYEQPVEGTPGNAVHWQVPMNSLWLKDGVPVDFTASRVAYGVVIKNSAGLPVSDWSDYGWGGEDPDEWYPLDMQFTVLAIEEGAQFSDWRAYDPER